MNRLKWDKDFALEQAADDADLLQELLTIFKQSCASDYRTITRGLVSKDAAMICASAHPIKGAAAGLGPEPSAHCKVIKMRNREARQGGFLHPFLRCETTISQYSKI